MSDSGGVAATATATTTADGAGASDGGLRHQTAKLYVTTTKQREFALSPGDRFEFAIAVRDGMTIDARAVFKATVSASGDRLSSFDGGESEVNDSSIVGCSSAVSRVGSPEEEIEVLPMERVVAVQGKYDCTDEGGGTLTIQLSNEFAWRASLRRAVPPCPRACASLQLSSYTATLQAY